MKKLACTILSAVCLGTIFAFIEDRVVAKLPFNHWAVSGLMIVVFVAGCLISIKCTNCICDYFDSKEKEEPDDVETD